MYKERLEEYINEDAIFEKFKKGVLPESDFDEFCIRHCQDIEALLKMQEIYDERWKNGEAELSLIRELATQSILLGGENMTTVGELVANCKRIVFLLDEYIKKNNEVSDYANKI